VRRRNGIPRESRGWFDILKICGWFDIPKTCGCADEAGGDSHRPLRAMALLILGSEHPLVHALADAEHDALSLAHARCLLDDLTPIRHRRLLAAYAAVVR
jgi:hypothetical protein